MLHIVILSYSVMNKRGAGVELFEPPYYHSVL